MSIAMPLKISGMSAEELETTARLIGIWEKKKNRNALKKKYYDMKNKAKDLGISIPPELKDFRSAVGWPAKAVDYLASRSRFDGFVFEESDESEKLMSNIVRDNCLKNTYRQAVTSELIHSCSFLTVSKGAKGEPNVIVSAYSAENGAAEYDNRKKRIKNGLTIVDVDDEGNPSAVNVYTEKAVIEVERVGGRWTAERKPHPQGRPLMEPLVYRPSIDRPFGKSRINRAVMSLTDSAIRTAIRTEVSAEFFTSPQKYLLGAPDTIFEDKTKWDAYVGAIFAISKDEDGDIPQFGQLAQMSMQPHIDQMRSLAARFAGETSIPVSSLGVIHDNPSSAEAMYAATEDLIIEAEDLNDVNGSALRNIGMLALAIANGKTVEELTESEMTITPKFRNPAMPSIVSQSDAMVKQAGAAPWIAETDVFLEELGYTEEQRTRMLADKRKADASNIVTAMKEKVASGTQETGANVPAAATAPPVEVASKMLNGAQTQSLISIMAQYASGSLTEGQAVNLIATSIGVSKTEARSLLNGDIE